MIYDLSNKYDQEKFKFKSNAYYSGGKKVELKLLRGNKSVGQMKYVHVLFNLYAVENGYTAAESKELVKSMCPLLKYYKNNEQFTKGMSDLDKEEMSAFIDWFRDFAGKQGCSLPDAGVYEKDYQHFDNEIGKHSQYL